MRPSTNIQKSNDLRENEFVDLANVRMTGDMYPTYVQILEENYDPYGSKKSIVALKNEIVYESIFWCVIENQWSYKGKDDERVVRNHLVVILKGDFVQSPTKLEPKQLLDAHSVFSHCVRKFNIEGGAMLWRFGNTRLSGASVKRLHFHIIEPILGNQITAWLGCKTKED